MSEINVVAVIKSIHDPNKRKYDEKLIMVPVEIAEDQLSKPEDQRNFTWRGVRFASDEEIAIYSGEEPKEKAKPGRPKAVKPE